MITTLQCQFFAAAAVAPWVNNAAITHAWVADTQYVDAASVGTWTAQKGGANLLQGTAAAKPAWAATTWNGKGGITFDGVNDCLVHDPLAALVSGDDKPWSLILAWTPLAVATKNLLGFGRSTSGTQSQHVFFMNAAGTLAVGRQGDSGAADTDTTTETVTASTRYVTTILFSGTTITIRQNGVVTTVNAAAQNVGVTTLDKFTLGGLIRNAGLLAPANIRVRTTLFAAALLTSGDYTPSENYLMAEGGI